MNYYSNYYFNKYANAQQGFTVPSSYLNTPNYEYLIKTAADFGQKMGLKGMQMLTRVSPEAAIKTMGNMEDKDINSVTDWLSAAGSGIKDRISEKWGFGGGNKSSGGSSDSNWSKYLPYLALAGGGALLGGGMGGWGGALAGGLGLPVAAWAIMNLMNQNKQKGSNSNSGGSSWFGSSKNTQNKAPQAKAQAQQPDPRVQQLQQAAQDPVGYAQNVAQQRYNQVMAKNPPQRMVGNEHMQDWVRGGTPITMPSNYLGDRNGHIAPFNADTNNASGLRFDGNQMTKQQIDEQHAINGVRQANAMANLKKYREQLEAQKDQMTPEEYASKMKRIDDRYAAFTKRNVAAQKELGTVAKEHAQAAQQTDKGIRENRVQNAKTIVNTAKK